MCHLHIPVGSHPWHTLCIIAKQGISPRDGLPKLRQPWVERRGDDGSATCTQMHYAKSGVVTEEMAFVAAREQLPVDFVVSEVRGCGLL